MTTHNSHSEHSDVEVSVAEHQHASESATSTPSSEPTALVQESDAPFQPVETPLANDSTAATATTTEDAGPSMDVSRAQEEPPNEVLEGQGNREELPQPSPTEDSPPASTMSVKEEVRPFTDFIEEFRQAEARFSSSLQAYAGEALSVEVPSAALAPTVETFSLSAAPGTSTDEEEEQSARTHEPDRSELSSEATPPSDQGLTEASSTTTNTGAGGSAIPPTRPVSPLLRPASRLRLPRHGVGRQREEAPINRTATPEATTSVEEAKVEPTAPEPAAVEEQPKPARRYRFDRPATTNGSTTPSTQPRSEEVKDSNGRSTPSLPARTDTSSLTNGSGSEKEGQTSVSAKSMLSTTSTPEQSSARQPVVQDIPAIENTTPSAPTLTPQVQEHDRRKRHAQERQRSKEQPSTIAPVTPTVPVAAVAPTLPATPAELVPTVAEPTTTPAEEVNPEDLPPLEYAELQKANSRRRRRRHPGGTVAVPAVASTPIATKPTPTPIEETPVAPTPASTPVIAAPRTPAPAASSTPASQYTITSGYTVSQMNKGNGGASPFMGPEPSPARGSIAAQNVRSIRTDVQRVPAYPVRTTEATSASVQQLANVVSQAIQTQTDRMVAELRRANQSPTNVSVSLPPFPSTERVGVFVDVANLLYSARNLRMTVDFGKLLDFLRGNRRLVRAQAYCPTSPQPGDEQMFLQAVKGLGYRITTKNYKTFSSGAKKADLDLDLCMDVVRLVDGKAVDCVVLVSGDSDFMPMLDYCSDHGVRVEVAAFDESMSATLRQSCDLFINLGMLDEIRA